MGKPISRLIKKLREYDEKKLDEIQIGSSIQMAADTFVFMDKPIKVSGTALKQLCTIGRIPSDFFINRLKREEQAMIFNRLFSGLSETRYMFRFSQDTLYGIVSPSYTKLDNVLLIDILKDAANTGLDLVPVKSLIHPDHTKVRLVPEGMKANELVPMVEFTNSENGMGSLRVWAGVFRVVCGNGLLSEVISSKSRWIHYGSGKIQMPDYEIILNQSIEYVARMEAAKSIYLSASDKTEMILRLSGALGPTVADKVVDVANGQYRGALTLFDAINSVTQAAKSFSAQKQSETELFSSTLLAA
ncbi:MAG: DUF932 domain-containing protein [bacterium]